MSTHTRRATRRTVLADPTYRALFGAQVVALLGTGLLTVALSLLAFQVAPGRAGVVVATALSLKMVAYVLVAPVAAAAVVRLSPRSVLLGANVARGIVALGLPWVDQVWQIYVLIVVLQSASATFTPAFQAVIPTVLPDEDDYTRALSLSRLAYDLESVVSPAAAAALLVVMSYHGLFVATSLGFGLSALLVLRAGWSGARWSGPVAGADRSFGRRLTRGASLFLGDRLLRVLLALYLVVATATALVLVDTVVVVRQDLGLGEAAVAWTLGAFGAGSMVVALCVPAALRRFDDRTVMLGGAVATAVATVLTGVVLTGAHPWIAVIGLWFVLGAGVSAVLTPAGRVITRLVTSADRPAAFAAAFSLSHACFLLTYPLAGWVGSRWGVATAALVLGGLGAIGAALAVTGWRRVDTSDRALTDAQASGG